jgi:hypothetical protein
MRFTTKNGVILNPRFLREIRLDERNQSATAIGDDGREHDLELYELELVLGYEGWKRAFDPVIPGSGILLAVLDPSSWGEAEPTMEDLGFVESTIVGWRIPSEGGALPITALSDSQGNITLLAIKEIDRWAVLGEDGVWARRFRDVPNLNITLSHAQEVAGEGGRNPDSPLAH